MGNKKIEDQVEIKDVVKTEKNTISKSAKIYKSEAGREYESNGNHSRI